MGDNKIKNSEEEEKIIDLTDDGMNAVAMSAHIYENEVQSGTDAVVDALHNLVDEITQARDGGVTKGKEIVDHFGGEGKLNELITDLAGFMGGVTATGIAMGKTPFHIMQNSAKGIYDRTLKKK